MEIEAHKKGKISLEEYNILTNFAKEHPNRYQSIIDRISKESSGLIETPTIEDRKIVHIMGAVMGFYTRRYPTRSKDRYGCGKCSRIDTLSKDAEIIRSVWVDRCYNCSYLFGDYHSWTKHYPATVFKHVEFNWYQELPKTTKNQRKFKRKQLGISMIYSSRGRFKKLNNDMPFQDIDIITN